MPLSARQPVLLLLAVFMTGCGSSAVPSGASGNVAPESLPLRLDTWRGKDVPLKSDVRKLVGADACISRTYHEGTTREVSAFIATYSDWDVGMRQLPPTVYTGAGFRQLESSLHPIQVGDWTATTHLSTWRLGDRSHVVMMYWYQLGDRVLLEPADLQKVDAAQFPADCRPKLIKVQLGIGESSDGGNERAIKRFAREIAKWLHESFAPS